MFLLFYHKGNKVVLSRSYIHHLAIVQFFPSFFIYMKQKQGKSPRVFLGGSNEPLELKPF